LQSFQITGIVANLCKQQKSFICKGYLSTINESPENLVLEEFKRWLIKISRLPSNKFDSNFITEIKQRLDSLNEFMQIQTWQIGFVQELSNLIQLTSAILKFTQEKDVHLKCRNTLDNLTIECRNVLDNAIKFLCEAIEDKELKQSLHNKTAHGLSVESQSLSSDFYGQLIISVIGADGFSNIYHLPSPPKIDTIPRAQTPLQIKFSELSQRICTFVNFFHICNQYKATNTLCGSLFVACLMQDNDRINNVYAAFNVFVDQFNTNIEDINQAYKRQIKELNRRIKSLAKKCCTWREISKIGSQRDRLSDHAQRMQAYGYSLIKNLNNCQTFLGEIGVFASNAPQREMQILKTTMQGLIVSVSKFITSVRGIEYPDSLGVTSLTLCNPTQGQSDRSSDIRGRYLTGRTTESSERPAERQLQSLAHNRAAHFSTEDHHQHGNQSRTQLRHRHNHSHSSNRLNAGH